MDCDAAFDNWYAGQKHLLSNEDLCRLIWRRGWEHASKENIERKELEKLAFDLNRLRARVECVLWPNSGSETAA